jgi:hypothetical protein
MMPPIPSKVKAKLVAAMNECVASDEPLPRELFHYCSSTGLLGIIEEKLFRASDVLCMNDSSEIQHGLQVLDAVLSARSDSAKGLVALLPGLQAKFTSDWSTHVSCFSDGADLMSQWRTYGAGGHGFAIGFDRTQLETLSDAALVRMEYDSSRQKAKVNLFMDRSLEIMTSSALPVELTNSFWFEVFMQLLGFVASFKRAHFKEEREWRALTIQTKGLKFRAIRGAVVPYVEVEFPASAVKCVMRGPSLENTFSHALRRFLDHSGCSATRIEKSDIPLREVTT